jgi:hypothetical protein
MDHSFFRTARQRTLTSATANPQISAQDITANGASGSTSSGPTVDDDMVPAYAVNKLGIIPCRESQDLCDLAIHPRHPCVAYATSDGVIRTKGYQPVRSFSSSSKFPEANSGLHQPWLQCSGTGDALAVWNIESILLYDCDTTDGGEYRYRNARTLRLTRRDCLGAGFVSSDRELLTVSSGDSVAFLYPVPFLADRWDARTGDYIRETGNQSSKFINWMRSKINIGKVTPVYHSRHRPIVLVSEDIIARKTSVNNKIVLYRRTVDGIQFDLNWTPSEPELKSFAITNDGKSLISISPRYLSLLTRNANSEPIGWTVTSNSGLKFSSLAISPHGEWVAASQESKRVGNISSLIQVYDAEDATMIWETQTDGTVSNLVFSPDGYRFAYVLNLTSIEVFSIVMANPNNPQCTTS